ncbi:MAG: LytR/AlgR family response regulator transcription factor [Cyclobacteriaceae bacterium]
MSPNLFPLLQCLVVDDQPSSCRVVSQYISRTDGLQFSSSVSDGMQAFDYLQTHPEIHLVFLDVEMPEMSGFDLIAALEHENHAPLPLVILTTGHAKYATQGYDFDRVVGFLQKLVNYQDFLRMVQKARRAILQYSNDTIVATSHLPSQNTPSQNDDYLLLRKERDMLAKAFQMFGK